MAFYYNLNTMDKEKIKKQIDTLLHLNIEDGNVLNDLGTYYHHLDDDENMKKYYLLAIEKNNIIAMNNLGNYYNHIKNYDEMIKYYLLACDNHNWNAMIKLGNYYKNINNYKKMKKYYLMAETINNNLWWFNSPLIKIGDYYIIFCCISVKLIKNIDYNIKAFKYFI